MKKEAQRPTTIQVIGGKVNNLKNIDVAIPLNRFVAISGLSGSGKSSLALGILYAEGSSRYLAALSTYTRRRINQARRTQVQEVKHIPAALALKQRPAVPSERSTVGTMSELFNVIRLVFSRLGSPVCPNGHRIKPTLKIAQAMDRPPTDPTMGQIECPVCGIHFSAYSAEDFSFNAAGACPECEGTGKIRVLDPTKLIGDENKTLAEGAVASWHLPGRNFMYVIAEKLGVRSDVPYKDLTEKEKAIVLHGAKKKYPVDITTNTGRVFRTQNALYENAYEAVYSAAKSVKSERAIAQVDRFFHFSTCPTCHGTRLNPKLLSQLAGGSNIAQVTDLTLGELTTWQQKVTAELPVEMQTMAAMMWQELQENLRPLLELGLDYLTLARNGNTLSTGELQRIELARTLRSETTGVLYVLDEPSIGLHPDNIKGLLKVFQRLVQQGNSLVVVDHEVAIISQADWVIEIGPGSGELGGKIIATGTPENLTQDPHSLIGPFITGKAQIKTNYADHLSDPKEFISFHVTDYFNLHNVTTKFPTNQITAITGFSGAGKSSLILKSLVPAIKQNAHHQQLPAHVDQLVCPLKTVVSIDASPVGKNERSTLATYTNIMDNLRQLFAALPIAKEKHYGISYFSYNNKEGACPTCNGQGIITLDVQYLPDIVEVCPTCHGTRFKPEIQAIKWEGYSIVDLLALSVRDALPVFQKIPKIHQQLQLLADLGLDYLHLGESTPRISGGEAQRLKLVKHLYRQKLNALFVFDEPSIGLHPLDVQVLIHVLHQLIEKGATIILITHDLDLMLNADYLIDLGPKGGAAGGKIMAAGEPLKLIQNPTSLTLRYLAKHWQKFQPQE